MAKREINLIKEKGTSIFFVHTYSVNNGLAFKVVLISKKKQFKIPPNCFFYKCVFNVLNSKILNKIKLVFIFENLNDETKTSFLQILWVLQ